MSYDFATQQICEHEVLFERIDPDPFTRNTIRFLRPPSAGNVRIYIDNAEIPRNGLYSTPELAFGPEPYRLARDQSDYIIYQVAGSGPVAIPLITGNVSALDLVQYLTPLMPEIIVSCRNHRVYLTARAPSRGIAFSFPDPRWTDKASTLPFTARVLGGLSRLGISPGRMVTGKLLYPGWALIVDPNSFIDEQVILFDSPLLNDDPVVQVSYFTNAVNCRRCQGTKIEYDYRVMGSSFETVKNTDLLLQEFDKFLFTRARSHWKWPWLGSNLSERIGGKANTAFNTVGAFLTMDVSQAFQSYQSIKTTQDSLIFQQLSDSEFPFSLIDVSVQSPPDDPTVALVNVIIQSRSRDPIEVTRVVGNPNPFFIAGNPTPFRVRA